MKCIIDVSSRGSVLGLTDEVYLLLKNADTGETLAARLTNLKEQTEQDLRAWAKHECYDRIEELKVESRLLRLLNA